MSIKLRTSLWFTLMVLLLSVMILVFVLVVNGASITGDPTERLVKLVNRNVDDVEFDNGKFDWDDLDLYKNGVSCVIYDNSGNFLKGAKLEGMDLSGYPLKDGLVRKVVFSGQDYLMYDVFVDMDISGIWIRGLVKETWDSGLMDTIVILTCILLPCILVLAFGGGWLISWGAFRPMNKILAAADSISGGGDLSARINLKRGPEEMRRLSRSFDAMFARLEKSFEAERQFTSDASHELRTPITVILAQCDRAKRKDKTPEEFTNSINVIQEQTRGMSELVQGLLGITRLQHGTDRYKLKKADLSQFCLACAGEFMPENKRGIELTCDVESGIEAEFNPALMQRLIINLLQNGYKYGKENGHVTLSLRKMEQKMVLSVKDDGIGIAPEDLEKIWQRFWQADPSRNDSGSSGLGLSMVKEIVDFHGGSIRVESKLGKGSEFIITI